MLICNNVISEMLITKPLQYTFFVKTSNKDMLLNFQFGAEQTKFSHIHVTVALLGFTNVMHLLKIC